MVKFRIDLAKDKGITSVIDLAGQAAFHKGYRSCFFRRIEGDDTVIESPVFLIHQKSVKIK